VQLLATLYQVLRVGYVRHAVAAVFPVLAALAEQLSAAEMPSMVAASILNIMV